MAAIGTDRRRVSGRRGRAVGRPGRGHTAVDGSPRTVPIRAAIARLTVATRAARSTLPTRQEYLHEWSTLHGDASTGGLVGWWLGLAHALAGPLIRLGAGPDALTVLGLLV